MPVFHRFCLLLVVSAALVLLHGCESSLDLDSNGRKEIPLDPADTTPRVQPDLIEFELYLKNGWDDSRTRLSPSRSSIDVLLDTTGQIPVIWANIDCTLNDIVFDKSGSTQLVLNQLRFRVDSVIADGLYELSGSPGNGNGTSVQLIRYNNGSVLDTLAVIPPAQPSKVDSDSELSLVPTGLGNPGAKKITGVYTFSATVYDQASQQVIHVPLEGMISVHYH